MGAVRMGMLIRASQPKSQIKTLWRSIIEAWIFFSICPGNCPDIASGPGGSGQMQAQHRRTVAQLRMPVHAMNINQIDHGGQHAQSRFQFSCNGWLFIT